MRISLAVAAWLFILTSAPADWPQFLGPNRDGVSTEDIALANDLPDDGLKRLWSHDVGEGFAGPVIFDQRCLIFHRRDDRALLEALDAKTGERQWVFDYATDYVDKFGFDAGPRSCPTVAGDRVFIYGAEGLLHAVQLSDGALLWKKDLARDFESPPGFFGCSSAPLAAEGLVLLDIGGRYEGKPANFVAFDAGTGEVEWTAGEGEADCASPMLLKSAGQSPLALFFVRNGFAGVDLRQGDIRFQERFRSSMQASVNAASPVVLGERFFLSSCYGVGAGLWEWSGDNELHQIYKHADALDCHFGTPIHHEGFLYGFHGRQESGQELRCVSLSDAEVRWETPLPAGSAMAADGKLLVLTEQGELLVAALTPVDWQVHYRAQITGAETRALPALADGHFYARDKRRLTCVDLR